MSTKTYMRALLAAVTVGSLSASPAFGQVTEEAKEADQMEADDQENLAKQIQNPLATVVTLPFQANHNQDVGEFDRTITNINFQPVIPFPGEKWNLVSRSIIPYISIPIGETAAETGLGDLTTTLFASPAKPGSVIWGVGPVFQIPTASNPELLGTDKFSIGPSAVLFWGPGNWTLGAVVWQLWSVTGNDDREAVSALTAQWFLNYNLGKGWVLGTAPIITCNWKAESGDQCTVPWGGQLSKVLMFGSRPVNLLAGYYSNSEFPTGGAESQVRFQINLLYPQ